MLIIEWTGEDAAYLRNIFKQPSGQKFLAKIKSAVPKVSATKMEEVGIQALKKQGAEDLLDFIETLAWSEPELKEGRDYVDLSKEGT